MVAHRNGAHVLVRLHVLDVGLDDRAIAANRGDLIVLARDDAVDRLIDGGYRRRGSRSFRFGSRLIGCLRLRG